ncbi:hypothetical protein CKM354_001249200 [Cercospora kikuchii]|uniref:Uncharacterized protein n=1 Tax=Cercospora kikuchii TaxID=84275 RepID=A0A9P3FM33_9PEZI|nr:uncharacterized protein CKM354_001249200 [Cercospora kikuchii]GIZ49462.1 hypothetical protein CKM354_001249200 [Cercospora kikuchii]
MRLTLPYITADRPEHARLFKDNLSHVGATLYEAIAKELIGTYEATYLIKRAVLHFAHRVRAQQDHAFHGEYLKRESHYQRSERLPLYSGLECPDLRSNQDIMWVVAFALNIRLQVFFDSPVQGQAPGTFVETGPTTGRIVTVAQRAGSGIMRYTYVALLPNKSGKTLVEYLLRAQQVSNEGSASAIRIERVTWIVAPMGHEPAVTCFNGLRTNFQLDAIEVQDTLARLDTFQIVVHDPTQIGAALVVMEDALRCHQPHQSWVRVGSNCAPSTLRPYISADLEMAKVPRSATNGKTPHQVQEMMDRGEIEALVSVLTISIGGRLVVHFNILEMMENPTHNTVPALRELFDGLVLNPQFLLLWWNLQNDIVALDNTIAHLYQGTLRQPFYSTPYGATQPILVMPQFHLHSEHFRESRPGCLMFPTQPTYCDLHLPYLSERGLACPCSTGNIDIGPLLSHACRQHGRNIELRPWYEARPHVKLEALIDTMLAHDPLAPLFKYLKNSVERSGRSPLDFYQSLGQQGMENDDNVLGYLSGDADVPGRIFELIFASNDAEFIAGRLLDWENLPNEAQVGAQFIPQLRPSGEYVEGISLDEKGPNLPKFHFDPVFPENSWVVNTFKSDVIFARNDFLEPWEHDTNVKLMRRRLGRLGGTIEVPQKAYYELPSYDENGELELRRQKFRIDMTDTSKFWLPTSCAKVVLGSYYRPIMRTNQTSTEYLIEHLQFLATTAKASPPPGFGAAPGTQLGLPKELNRIPGFDLYASHDILRAYRGVHHVKPWFFPPPQRQLMRMQVVLSEQPAYDLEVLTAAVKEHLSSLPVDERQAVLDEVREILRSQIRSEIILRNAEGPPSFVDLCDLLDPEGRTFRRRVERTVAWNRPALLFGPFERFDGGWLSAATLEFDALDGL